MMPMMSWFGGLGMLIPALTLFVLIVGTIVLLLDRLPNRDQSTHDDDSAALLRMRYAAGEIDTEEYRRRLTDLHTTTGAGR